VLRVRAHLAVALCILPLLAGCMQPAAPEREAGPAPVEPPPRVEGVRREHHNLTSWDGETTLALVVDVPLSQQPGARWPVALFLHGWGGSKEDFTGQAAPGAPADEAADRLRDFARRGFIAAAFDARGFGQSGGLASVAGPAEQADLDWVLRFLEGRLPGNGRAGVVGASYGGGQALLAAVRNPGVDAAVSMYGWADLAEGLIPGNVPKLQWGQFLYAYGHASSRGRYDPMVHDWYLDAIRRDHLDTIRAQMDLRSSASGLAADTTPLLVCQGMQETLFPQADRIARAAGGFTRTFYFTGGHGAGDPECWRRTVAWLQFFLAGHDTGVDSWPLLETVDANGADRASYDAWPDPEPAVLHLRHPDLVPEPSDASFTVRQTFVAGAAGEPSAVWEQSGRPAPAIPQELLADPGATWFAAAPLEAAQALAGAAVLRLHVAGEPPFPFQVAAALHRVDGAGHAHLLGRAAAAALGPGDLEDGSLELRFPWVRAQLQPGETLQLKVASNDPGAWYPLLADYTVSFDGRSRLELPLE
jgi:hypothetical protein